MNYNPDYCNDIFGSVFREEWGIGFIGLGIIVGAYVLAVRQDEQTKEVYTLFFYVSLIGLGIMLLHIVFSPQTLIADSLERYLHNKFEKNRVEGEFFSGVEYEKAVECLWDILNDRQYDNCVKAREVYIKGNRYHKNLIQYHNKTKS